jgi:hypothetical protein
MAFEGLTLHGLIYSSAIDSKIIAKLLINVPTQKSRSFGWDADVKL